MAEIPRLIKEIEATTKGPEEKAAFERTKSLRAAWAEKLDQALKAINAGDFSPAVMAQFLNAVNREGETAIKSMVEYRDTQVKQAKDAFTTAEIRYRNDLIAFVLVIVSGLLLAVGFGIVLIRSISRSLGHAVDISNAVALGDLSQTIHPRNRS